MLVTVVYAGTMDDVPRDGKTIGEVLLKGNITMKGYLGDPKETEKVFRDGWLE